MNQQQIEAFWSKVEITDSAKDCWAWSGAKKPSGYGNVRVNKKYLLAHRVAFEVAVQKIPDGLIVCHVCDNPSCCNPSHLMLGTVKSNACDMLIKNRQKKKCYATRGENNGNSKLSRSEVLDIRESYKSGLLNQYQLAELYDVSQATIGAIVRNKTWRL